MLSAELEAADQLIRAGDFFRVLKALKKLIPTDAFPSRQSRTEQSSSLRQIYVARVNGWKQRR